jgi:hypothetical protein
MAAQANVGASVNSAERISARDLKLECSVYPPAEIIRCYLGLANMPNFALDRRSRYEAALWRQAGQVLFALDAFDRRKPQERRFRFPW